MSVILKAENISKVYKRKQVQAQALKGISLEFEKSRFYSVIGRSGSGKSTLLHILSGLDRPTEGTVYFEGKDLYQYSDEKMAVFRRRYMGFVFQQYNLMEEYNILENICMPVKLDKRTVDTDFLEEVLQVLRLKEQLKKYPAELSGGEQQRAAIARSVVARPKIIFADEPTGNLDKKTSMETMELLLDCAGKFGQTLIIVTHDLEIARMSERIIKIEDGEISESMSI